jgi:hypothetical protein
MLYIRPYLTARLNQVKAIALLWYPTWQGFSLIVWQQNLKCQHPYYQTQALNKMLSELYPFHVPATNCFLEIPSSCRIRPKFTANILYGFLVNEEVTQAVIRRTIMSGTLGLISAVVQIIWLSLVSFVFLLSPPSCRNNSAWISCQWGGYSNCNSNVIHQVGIVFKSMPWCKLYDCSWVFSFPQNTSNVLLNLLSIELLFGYIVRSAITVAAQSNAWTVFARSNARIVGSNPTQGMDVCIVCVYSVFVFCV